jgi:antitoxin component YwqK of YwqJK toxin-antitoxin module
MKILKLVLKIAIGIVGLFVVLIVVLLTSESYETVTKNNGNEIVVVEIKKAFGKKISECSINSDGFYHGPSKSWSLFKGTLRSEGNFKEGYWNGRWKDYDREGQLIMFREWSMGKLKKVFVPFEEDFKELPENEWPKYVDITQSRLQRAHQ